MAELLTQVKESTIRSCPYHNTRQWPSLYTNHVCERDDFPLDTVCELDKHSDEVWFLAFSNDGTRLATAGKDGLVVIYETQTFQILHTLPRYKASVAYVAWSPDDKKIITCSHVYQNDGPPPFSRDHAFQVWDTEVIISCRAKIESC